MNATHTVMVMVKLLQLLQQRTTVQLANFIEWWWWCACVLVFHSFFSFLFKFRAILAGRPYHLLSHTSAKWKIAFEFHRTNSAFKCAKYTEMEWELREGQHRPKVQPHKQTTRIVFELLNFARIQCTICVCYQCECALFSILKGIVLVFCIVFRVVRAEAPVLFS